MRLDPKTKIAGLPALQIRDLLHSAHRSSGIGLSRIARELHISQKRARNILNKLIDLNFLSASQFEGGWCTTTEGARIALATGLHPITRKKADELVQGIVTRAKEINQNPFYISKVLRMTLFGSYLTDSPTLNDVDVIVELKPKSIDMNVHWKLTKQKSRYVHWFLGRRFAHDCEAYMWAEEEVLRHLKSKRRISIHPQSDLKIAKETKVIFEDLTADENYKLVLPTMPTWIRKLVYTED